MIQQIEDLENKIEEIEAQIVLDEEETSEMLSEVLSTLIELNSKIDAIAELCVAAQVFDLDVFVRTSQDNLTMLYQNLAEKGTP